MKIDKLKIVEKAAGNDFIVKLLQMSKRAIANSDGDNGKWGSGSLRQNRTEQSKFLIRE